VIVVHHIAVLISKLCRVLIMHSSAVNITFLTVHMVILIATVCAVATDCIVFVFEFFSVYAR